MPWFDPSGDERAAVIVGGRSDPGDNEVVAGNVREAAKVDAVGKAVAAGRETLVATGSDGEGIAYTDRFAHRLPERELHLAADNAMPLNLDRKAAVCATHPCQASGGDNPFGKTIEAFHGDGGYAQQARHGACAVQTCRRERDLAARIAEVGGATRSVE